jgi:hypothetical protein
MSYVVFCAQHVCYVYSVCFTVLFFICVRLVYVTELSIINLERAKRGRGKKPWWLNLQCYPRVVVEGLKKTMENVRREGRRLVLSSSEFEAEVLMIGSQKCL